MVLSTRFHKLSLWVGGPVWPTVDSLIRTVMICGFVPRFFFFEGVPDTRYAGRYRWARRPRWNSVSSTVVLTTSIHNGNNSAIHGQLVITSKSTNAKRKPRNDSQRGRIRVRNTIVLVENMNTPAILIAKTFKEAPINWRTKK